MTQAEGHAAGARLRRQLLRHPGQIGAEVVPRIGLAALRLGRVAVAARVHGDDAVAGAKRPRHGIEEGRAEAVGVVQQGQGPAAAPVEQRDLDSRFREREPAAANVGQHGRPVSRLAGRGASFEYAPRVRSLLDDALRDRVRTNLSRFERLAHAAEDGAPLRSAAVAVTLIAGGSDEPCFVITRRAAGLRAHAGQWALPGGRLDPGESVQQAALRELREEVGLELPPESALGCLDDYPTRSGFAITPVVVWAGDAGPLAPNPEEVAAAYRVPLAELDRPDVPVLRAIPESDRPLIAVPLLGTTIHAPTAAILYQTREVALRGLDTRVAQYDQPVFAWS